MDLLESEQLYNTFVLTVFTSNNIQACFSADFAEAEQHLQALKELCDTLSPEDAHRLAQTQLRECETRLAAIQRQFSGDQDAPLPDSRWGSKQQRVSTQSSKQLTFLI